MLCLYSFISPAHIRSASGQYWHSETKDDEISHCFRNLGASLIPDKQDMVVISAAAIGRHKNAPSVEITVTNATTDLREKYGDLYDRNCELSIQKTCFSKQHFNFLEKNVRARIHGRESISNGTFLYKPASNPRP